jgi:RIO kinase 1
MRVPEVLSSLTDQGLIDEVLRPLKSGKEAQVYLVRAGGEVRVAKVYKDAGQRSFKQRTEYMEGRRVRNTRDQRAIDRRSRHGKAQQEEAWKSAEVDVIYRLHAGGVRVPEPYNFIDGVLLMELVRGADGGPAPRLAEVVVDPAEARALFDQLLGEVVKMLCAGIVHGDLSDYNVLVDAEGPVVIDFPQSVDASQNRNARKLLVRDVDNLSAFLSRAAPGTRRRPYGEELWAAYENNLLTPEFELTGEFRRSNRTTDMGSLLEFIEEAESDERLRRQKLGLPASPRRKREVVIVPSTEGKPSRRGGRKKARPGGASATGGNAAGAASGRSQPSDAVPTEGAPRKRRRRRRGGQGGSTAGPREGAPREGRRSDGAPREGSDRENGPRENGPREGTRRRRSRRGESRRRGSKAEAPSGEDSVRQESSRDGASPRTRARSTTDSGRADSSDARARGARGESARPEARTGSAAASSSATPGSPGEAPAANKRRRRRRRRRGSGDGPSGGAGSGGGEKTGSA